MANSAIIQNRGANRLDDSHRNAHLDLLPGFCFYEFFLNFHLNQRDHSLVIHLTTPFIIAILKTIFGTQIWLNHADFNGRVDWHTTPIGQRACHNFGTPRAIRVDLHANWNGNYKWISKTHCATHHKGIPFHLRVKNNLEINWDVPRPIHLHSYRWCRCDDNQVRSWPTAKWQIEKFSFLGF